MTSSRRDDSIVAHLLARGRDTGLAVACTATAVAGLYLIARWAGDFLGALVGGAPFGDLARRAAVGVALLALVSGSASLRDVTLVSLSASFSTALRLRMLRALVRQPAAMGRAGSSGGALVRVASDIALLHHSLVRTLAIWAPSVVTTVVLLVAIVGTSPALAAAMALLVAPMLFVIGRISGRLQGSVRLAQESVAQLGDAVSEALAAVREAKVFRREDAIERRFAELSRESVRQIVHEERVSVLQPALVTFVAFVGLCGLVLVAAWWQRRGGIDAAGLTRFLVLLALVASPLQEVMRSWGAVARVQALLARSREVLDLPVERDAADALDLPHVHGSLAMERVVVGYDATAFALGPIDVEVGAGKTLVIAGPSGSGKSTLLELIPRLADPSSGTIRLDGHDVRTLRLAALRAHCAFVPQEPFFFAGTIRENLTFSSPSVDDERLRHACRAAHVEEFVARLPRGYDTRLDRGAVNLSVGQRQRLALARAILVDPRVLLLDEPTAALDEESERLLVESLRTVTEGRTTVIVTHSPRLMTLGHRVVHLVNGRVAAIEVGPRASSRPDAALALSRTG